MFCDRYVPPAAVGLQARDRQTFPRGDVLEATVSSLTRRRSTAAVQVENQGSRARPSYPAGTNKRYVRCRRSRHELLRRHCWMRAADRSNTGCANYCPYAAVALSTTTSTVTMCGQVHFSFFLMTDRVRPQPEFLSERGELSLEFA